MNLQNKNPLVVIFGRTNVGKSTLFNCLVEKKQAMVSPIEGTTRDSNLGKVEWRGKKINLADTGGILDMKNLEKNKKLDIKNLTSTDDIDVKVQEQARDYLQKADLILFLVDSKVGTLPQDREMAFFLKKIVATNPDKSKNNILLVANKTDSQKQFFNIAEFNKLALGEPIPISASTGSGTGDLLDIIVSQKIFKSQVSSLKSKPIKIKTQKVLVLAGPNKSGKTTIAKMVSEKLNFKYLDIEKIDAKFFPDGKQWMKKNKDILKQAHNEILKKAKILFKKEENVVIDYSVFGEYLGFKEKFKKEFKDNFKFKILFPSKNTIIQRDKDKEIDLKGEKRINQVIEELNKIKPEIGEDYYIDTSEETAEETFAKHFSFLENAETELNDTKIKLCLIGKPNVGKSTLLNQIIGYERVIVSPIAHTTREPQDTTIEYKEKEITIIDTAGISKKGIKLHSRIKQDKKLEKLGIVKSLISLKKAKIALLVIDINQDVTHQDLKLVEEIVDRRASFIFLANKWDLIEDKDTKKYTQYIRDHFPFASWAPIHFASALTGSKVDKILDLAIQINKERQKKLGNSQLNKFLNKIVKIHKPVKEKGTKRPHIYELKQTRFNPPIFEAQIGKNDTLDSSYLRFIINRLRIQYGFLGTPINIYITHGKSEKLT